MINQSFIQPCLEDLSQHKMDRASQWTGQVSALEYIKTQFESDPSRFRAGYVHQSLFILENETHGIFASVPRTFIYQHFATIMGDDVHPLPPVCISSSKSPSANACDSEVINYTLRALHTCTLFLL